MGTGLLIRKAHLRVRPIARTITLALVAVTWCSGCIAVELLRDDPSAPRDRASRFDRFVAEWSLAMIDTASPLERIRLASSADQLDGIDWDEPRRAEARRRVQWTALKELEDDFPPGRLDPLRAQIARIIATDLRGSLGLALDAKLRGDEPPPLDEAEPLLPDALRAIATTPWSGALIEAPSVLLREHPGRTAHDVVRWWDAIVTLTDRLRPALTIAELPALGPVTEQPPRLVLDGTYDCLVRLSGSAGAGGTLDPILGPHQEAVARLSGPGASDANTIDKRGVQSKLRSSLEALVDVFDGFRDEADRDPTSRRRRLDGRALSGPERTAWLAGIRRDAGKNTEPTGLAGIARREIERLTRELGGALTLDTPGQIDTVRTAFRELRDRSRTLPGSAADPRSPQTLWDALTPGLDALVENLPEILLEQATARTFERPWGRWAPFVPGNLLPPGDPRARPAVFLAARTRDPVTPKWLHEAEALRYGVPGRGILDAFERAAVTLPMVLRATDRPAFEEGWGLYAVAEAAALDLLLDRDEGFGWRTQELIAFALLTVDVGLHGDGWSETEAVDYLLNVTPLPRSAILNRVTRVLAHPGRATKPAIGLLRIRALRRQVRVKLGDQFDAAEFHHALLHGGSLPVDEMDRRIDDWLEERPERPVDGAAPSGDDA